MPTPHNSAGIGDIAEVVLLPGDPLRAKYIAERFLDGARQVTGVRGMLGFTGTWRGNPVSVMGSGMGGPSCGLYAYELYREYDVHAIIRVGTCGGLQPELLPGDLVIAVTASTDSNYAYQYQLPGTYAPCADFALLERAAAAARGHSFRFSAGGVFSSDLFSAYSALGAQKSWEPWARMGCLAQDMETYALYCTAAYTKKRALSILTHTDSCVRGQSLPDNQRLAALEPMFVTALEAAFGA